MNIIGSKKFGSVSAAWSAAAGPNTDKALAQVLKSLGVSAKDVGFNTYLYVSDAGELIACNKRSRQSYPADEARQVGYLTAFTPNVNGIKSLMK